MDKKQKLEELRKRKSELRKQVQEIQEQIDELVAYDPKVGDSTPCARCGHAYYRHFDSYENMAPVGCKYCRCDAFVEGDATNAEEVW
jgi:hypothetical protein